MARAPFIVPALKKHTATVIMAHGLGDTMALAQNWRRRGKFDEVAFIFPNAPAIPITVLDLEDNLRTQDEAGILRSRDYFNTLIKEEMDKGIKASRIILGGFSQGGAMSLFAGVTGKEKLGGVFGLSSYLLLSDRIKNFVPEDWVNKKTPFWMGHGLDDDIVQFSYGQKSAEMLKALGLENVSFNQYADLGHSADPQEIDDLEKFIEKVLPAEEGNTSAGL
ncbi:hypothetical protein N7457_002569 [Penicillium paradoxum]|uniref:uncharacterized protein n=1 Tax=Penicillium paradoxum TaxID=176176 RepID=UPI0025495F52|nr:uncharacterized protein N7457_002569 [Penicillium paradoxum]KAJ5787579.1 hypothetical protein N7457_002569 [Penicillium paradoxum]